MKALQRWAISFRLWRQRRRQIGLAKELLLLGLTMQEVEQDLRTNRKAITQTRQRLARLETCGAETPLSFGSSSPPTSSGDCTTKRAGSVH